MRGHQQSALNMENAQPGHEVEFHGLQGATHLNGTKGHLVKFLKKEQRWAVRCHNEDSYSSEPDPVVNAKPENLKRVVPVQQQLADAYYSRTSGPDRPPSADTVASSSHGDLASLHDAVLDCFYKRSKGGVVVSCGDSYMLAVEFDGPFGMGGIAGEMVYVDKHPKAQAVVRGRRMVSAKELGRNFLLGETVQYIEATNESVFFDLLSRYKRHSSTQGLIDMKSGLKLYDVKIAK